MWERDRKSCIKKKKKKKMDILNCILIFFKKYLKLINLKKMSNIFFN